ncbi:MAG: hypothetical protein AVDCRST_MAG79-2932, partial [uncultured Thermoleophilia bacterium]
ERPHRGSGDPREPRPRAEQGARGRVHGPERLAPRRAAGRAGRRAGRPARGGRPGRV